jgi:uncharacterized protein
MGLRPATISGAAIALVVLALAACGDGDPVDDGARLLPEEARAQVTECHAYLLKDHDIDYRVVTRKSSADIDAFAAEAFTKRRIGSKSRTGKGLLLVIDAGQNQARLTVGHGLESVFPDAFAAYVELRQMVPFLRTGNAAEGVLAASELIITRADRAKAGLGPEGETWHSGSSGGAAPAGLNAGGRSRALALGPDFGPGVTPRAMLVGSLQALAKGDAYPQLSLHAPETRPVLAHHTLTPAPMLNAIRIH